MTRGRKKDHTIPLSRSLAHQRDYRARKAKYLAELEERCNAAEDESRRLRLELQRAQVARLSSASVYSPQAAQALSTLLQHLSAASSALELFQKLAFSDQQRHTERPSTPSLDSTPLPFPSATGSRCSPDALQPNEQPSVSQPVAPGTENSDEPCPMSPSLGSNCCGGWMDCTDLVDREDEDNSVQMHGHSSSTMVSNIRSKFQHAHRIPAENSDMT